VSVSVSVPRWALEFVMDRATFQDEGPWGTASSHWSRWLHWHYRCLDVKNIKPERTEYRFDVELGNRGMWYATSGLCQLN